MKWSDIPLYLSAISAWAAADDDDDRDCAGIKAISPFCQTDEAANFRDTFFVGGRYVASDGSFLMTDQLYVEKLTPYNGVEQPYPLVLMSADMASGSVWLNKPDNRKGWASYFLDKGYQVYIVDVAGNGRSSQEDVARYEVSPAGTVSLFEAGFTAPEKTMAYPQAAGHDQWPGSGVQGDPIFDAFFAASLPRVNNDVVVQLAMRAGGCQLLSLIGPSFLVSHSRSARSAAVITDQCPELVHANVNLEPYNVPFQDLLAGWDAPNHGRSPGPLWGLADIPLTYDPPVRDVWRDLKPDEVGIDTRDRRSCFLQPTDGVRTLTNLAKVPFVIFTASASVHTTWAHCIVAFLQQAGVQDVTWVKFEDRGQVGNGHFFFLEKNNLALADLVEAEIVRLASSVIIIR